MWSAAILSATRADKSACSTGRQECLRYWQTRVSALLADKSACSTGRQECLLYWQTRVSALLADKSVCSTGRSAPYGSRFPTRSGAMHSEPTGERRHVAAALHENDCRSGGRSGVDLELRAHVIRGVFEVADTAATGVQDLELGHAAGGAIAAHGAL